jgi:hypothetical protein
MPRESRNDEELCKASDHVVYEIERLCGTLHDHEQLNLAHHAGQDQSLWTHDALLESWTIHLRNTMHFLRGQQARASDILAEDYFDGSAWYELLAGIPGRTGIVAQVDEASLDRRINKEIVHLTYGRIGITVAQKQWPIGVDSQHLGRDLFVFVENVASERVAPNFDDRARTALRMLG